MSADPYGFHAKRVELAAMLGISIDQAVRTYTDEWMHQQRKESESRGRPITWNEEQVCAHCSGPSHMTADEKSIIVAALNSVYFLQDPLFPGGDSDYGTRHGVTVAQVEDVMELVRQFGEIARDRCVSSRIRARVSAVAP